MTNQLGLFDKLPSSPELSARPEQLVVPISIPKDSVGVGLTNWLTPEAILEFTKHYEVHSNHLGRILQGLSEAPNHENSLTEIVASLGLTSARVRGTLAFARKAGLVVGERTYRLLPLGAAVYQHASHLDNAGLLWLLHYRLASNATLVLWSTLFNDMRSGNVQFDAGEIVQKLSVLAGRWSEASLKDKAPGELRGTLKSYTEQVFVPLELITNLGGTTYEMAFNTGLIPPLVWLSVILVYRDQYYPGATSLEVPLIANAHFSPGRILRQSETFVRQALDALHQADLLTVETRSGLDQVRFRREITWLMAITRHLRGEGLK